MRLPVTAFTASVWTRGDGDGTQTQNEHDVRTWNRILMKMRAELVVASSVSTTFCSTPHETASVASRWPKNLATLRSLLVSSRWMRLYCRRKQSSNTSWYSRFR